MKDTTKKFIHIHASLTPISKPVAMDKTLVSIVPYKLLVF